MKQSEVALDQARLVANHARNATRQMQWRRYGFCGALGGDMCDPRVDIIERIVQKHMKALLAAVVKKMSA